MNTTKQTKKQRIVETATGAFQLQTWNPRAEEYNVNDIDVCDFEEKYVCHPLEAEQFYPEQFVVQPAGDWESYKPQRKAETGEGNAPRDYTPRELADRGKAAFSRSLDGYIIGKEDYKALLSEAQHQTSRAIKLEAQRDELMAALKVLVDHAQEMYPHFESARGQRDIAASLAAIAKAERV